MNVGFLNNRNKKGYLRMVGLSVMIYATVVLFVPDFQNLSKKSSAQQPVQSIRPDDIDSYPLEIPDANKLVEDLRSSKSVGISPINLKILSVKISNDSIKCSPQHLETFSVLIMVKTRPSERERRAQFRKSFRDQTNSLTKPFFQYGFLVGQSEEDLSLEIAKYRDFIVGDFQDSYRNLTFKTMMGIRWAVEFCPHFDFYVSLDVDVTINLERLARFLKDPYNYPDVDDGLKFRSVLSPQEQFYAGTPANNIIPIRDPDSHWYISYEDYPWSSYAPFPTGYFLLMSRTTITSFHYLSPYVRHLFADDAYMGILAQKLRIIPFKISAFLFDGFEIDWHDEDYYRKSYLKQAIAVHHIEYFDKYL